MGGASLSQKKIRKPFSLLHSFCGSTDNSVYREVVVTQRCELFGRPLRIIKLHKKVITQVDWW